MYTKRLQHACIIARYFITATWLPLADMASMYGATIVPAWLYFQHEVSISLLMASCEDVLDV